MQDIADILLDAEAELGQELSWGQVLNYQFKPWHGARWSPNPANGYDGCEVVAMLLLLDYELSRLLWN